VRKTVRNVDRRLTHTDYIRDDGVLRRLRPHAAICALGIDELRKHPAEILFLGRHAEEHTFRTHVPVKSLDIGNG